MDEKQIQEIEDEVRHRDSKLRILLLNLIYEKSKRKEDSSNDS